MESKDINHPHDSMPISNNDCTDELMNCTTECDTNDKECHDACIEEYHDCELPGENTEDVYWASKALDQLDEINAKKPDVHPLNDMNVDEGEIIAEILTLTALLNGKCTRTETLNSVGRSSKRIIIEYDVRTKGDQGSSQDT